MNAYPSGEPIFRVVTSSGILFDGDICVDLSVGRGSDREAWCESEEARCGEDAVLDILDPDIFVDGTTHLVHVYSHCHFWIQARNTLSSIWGMQSEKISIRSR